MLGVGLLAASATINEQLKHRHVMAPKTITVVDASNSERKKRLSNEDGYRNLLSEFRVTCLKEGDGVEIEDFESLVNGGTYTLGPQQKEQNGRLRCCFCILVFEQIRNYSLFSCSVRSTIRR